MVRLRDPEFRKKLIAEPADNEDIFTTRVMRWDRIFKLGDPPNYEPRAEDSVAAVAAVEGREPAEVATTGCSKMTARRFCIGRSRTTPTAISIPCTI